MSSTRRKRWAAVPLDSHVSATHAGTYSVRNDTHFTAAGSLTTQP